MEFVDEVTIHVASGRGGDGVVAFRREKYVPHGGPSGGDGGHGADVVLEVDKNLNTLVDFRYQSRYQGANGGRGGPNNKSGAFQSPLVITVPVGTSVYDIDKSRLIGDLTYHGQTLVVARGGRGGKGNAHFATSTDQAPKYSEFGEPGETVSLKLELKLLADVGVIGFPNAGKSTLIASASNAKPKIADYPFTTLVPNLGVVRVSPMESFVMADVPGLIKGASQGAGLGHRFLRHIERTRVLVHLVDCSPDTGRDPFSDYQLIRNELSEYKSALVELPEIIGLNKIDIPDARIRARECQKMLEEAYPECGTIRLLSTATGEGVQQLIWDAAKIVRQTPKTLPMEVEEVVRIEGPGPSWTIERGMSGEYVVKGRDPERLVSMTDLSNDRMLRKLHARLDAMGVLKELRKLGVKEGSTVSVAGFEFDWIEEIVDDDSAHTDII